MEIQPNKIGSYQGENSSSVEKTNDENIDFIFEQEKSLENEPQEAIIEFDQNNNLLITKRKGKDNGIWATLMESLKDLFDKDKSSDKIETEKILEKKLKINPKTKEMQIHDQYMEAKRQEYLVSHPQPQIDSQDGQMFGADIKAAYAQWFSNMNNYLKEVEGKYRDENPDYKAQIETFEKED